MDWVKCVDWDDEGLFGLFPPEGFDLQRARGCGPEQAEHLEGAGHLFAI
jgi:hypothetical protein